jgi:hypothetical protein
MCRLQFKHLPRKKEEEAIQESSATSKRVHTPKAAEA